MPSNPQRALEAAEDLVTRMVALMDARDLEGMMSLALDLTTGLVSAEAQIKELRERLEGAGAQDATDNELLDDSAAWGWEEPEAAPEPAPEPPQQDLSADFVYRTGPEVLSRCLERQAAQPRQSHYNDRHPLVPAWQRRGNRP